MKYRIKKVTYNGCVKYYPQHKHWWSWWHYFGYIGEWSDYVEFDTLNEAVLFLKNEKYKIDKIEYLYFNDTYDKYDEYEVIV